MPDVVRRVAARIVAAGWTDPAVGYRGAAIGRRAAVDPARRATEVTSDGHRDGFPTQMYIDGQWCDADGGETLAVINPADESTIAEVAFGGRAEAERGHRGRRAGASRPGGPLSAYDRAKILKKTADLMRERADAIARTLTQEQGKPLPEAKAEVLARGRHLRVVRRGGEARLRPDHPAVERRQAALRDQAPGRRRRHDHPLELPRRPAEPQDRPGAGRRLHGRQPPGRPDAADPDPDVRVPGRRRPARRAWPTSSWATPGRSPTPSSSTRRSARSASPARRPSARS